MTALLETLRDLLIVTGIVGIFILVAKSSGCVNKAAERHRAEIERRLSGIL